MHIFICNNLFYKNAQDKHFCFGSCNELNKVNTGHYQLLNKLYIAFFLFLNKNVLLLNPLMWLQLK